MSGDGRRPEAADGRGPEAAYALEAAIGRLLIAGTWVAMALIGAGALLMLATGVDPFAHDGIPPFEAAGIPAQVMALQPAGFLWAGIVLVIALPIGRVVVAGLGYLAARDGRLALVSLFVLLVVLVSVATALGMEA